MKKCILLLIATLTVSSPVMSAQMKTFRYNQAANAQNVMNMAEISFSPLYTNQIFDRYTTTLRMKAFSLNFAQARPILDVYPAQPLYLQYGMKLQYTHHLNEDRDDVNLNGTFLSGGFKVVTSYLTAKAPVNLTYLFKIPQTNLSFMPYTGMHMLLHIVGRQKDTEWTSVNGDKGTKTETKLLFKDEDMGGNACNRFGIGWQVGARLAYDNLLFGLGYEGDLLNLQKADDYKVKMSQVNISLGIMF